MHVNINFIAGFVIRKPLGDVTNKKYPAEHGIPADNVQTATASSSGIGM